jgi:branched-subunit amino acid transport protein
MLKNKGLPVFNAEYVLLVVGMGLVTYIPRWFPLFFLSRKNLPQWFVEWLDLIPVAILSALILPDLCTGKTPHHLDLLNPKLLIALPTYLFARKTRSLGGTVIVGMSLYWLVDKLF